MDHESPQNPLSPKPESLIPSLQSSISKLSSSSRAIPSNKDFHFYFNFQEFKTPIQEIDSNSQTLIQSIGSSKKIKIPNLDDVVDDDEAYDWLVNLNDDLFEKIDASVDEFKKLRSKEEESGVRVMGFVENDGFQLVQNRKKKDLVSSGGDGTNVANSPSAVKVASRDGNVKSKVPFHIASIRRPQDEYKILVNNSNQPFEHVWLERSEDGSKLIHPLEKLSVMDFIDKTVSEVEPVKPPPVESSSFKLVQDLKDLKELAAKLRAANEFAVSRPSFIPFWGIVKFERRIPLALAIDIIIEQAMFGIHIFRLESVAQGKASYVDELQIQGVSNPQLLRKVIVKEASKVVQDAGMTWRASVPTTACVRTWVNSGSLSRMHLPHS